MARGYKNIGVCVCVCVAEWLEGSQYLPVFVNKLGKRDACYCVSDHERALQVPKLLRVDAETGLRDKFAPACGVADPAACAVLDPAAVAAAATILWAPCRPCSAVR